MHGTHPPGAMSPARAQLRAPTRGQQAVRVPGRDRASRLVGGHSCHMLLAPSSAGLQATEPSCATSTSIQHRGLCPGTPIQRSPVATMVPVQSQCAECPEGCGCGMPAWHHSSSISSHHPSNIAESTTGHPHTGAWSCSAGDTLGQRWHCLTRCS